VLVYQPLNGNSLLDRAEHVACMGETRKKVKLKLSLCFNWAPRHEGVLGEWSYSSTHYL